MLQRLKAAFAALILLICFVGAAAHAEGTADLVLILPEGIATDGDGAARLVIGKTMKIGIANASGCSISFSSSNRKVATVDRAGLVKGLKNGRADIFVTARDSKGATRANRTLAVRVYTPLEKLALPAEALVLTGQRRKLTASFSPSTASDKALTWHSTDESVATVAKDGTVTAVSPGFSTITAIGSGGLSASCTLRVTDPAKTVEIDAPTGEKYLHVKKSLQLRATVRPESAFEGVTWRSANSKVVRVDASGRAHGRKVGTAKVYAITKDGTGIKGEIRLQVISPIARIKLAPAERVLVGRSKKLVVKFSPPKPSVRALKWMSSDESVAGVSANGMVTGRAPGQAIITCDATDGSGKSASCMLTVARPVEAISIRPENGHALVYKGERVRLVADVTPEDAGDKSLKWTSSNSARAKVNSQGVVVGIRPGKVTITAKAKDGSGTAQSVKLIVGTREKGIKLNKRDAVLYVNGEIDAHRSVRLSAKALPSGASYRELNWSVVQGESVTVNDGVVTAVREGVSTVRAITDNNHAETCRITVLRFPEALMLRTNAVTLLAGQCYDLGAEVLMDEACTERALSWSSNKPSVAAVAQNGVVTAAKDKTGTAIITAKSKNNLSDRCVVTVVKSLPERTAMAAPSEAAQGTGIPPEVAVGPEGDLAQAQDTPPEADEPEGEAAQEATPQDGDAAPEGEAAKAPGIPPEADEPEREDEQEKAVLKRVDEEQEREAAGERGIRRGRTVRREGLPRRRRIPRWLAGLPFSPPAGARARAAWRESPWFCPPGAGRPR